MVLKATHKGTRKEYAIKMITKTVSETTRFRFHCAHFKQRFIPISFKFPVVVFLLLNWSL